ncbi:MAG: ABC transporter ATP-binding protein [Clostridiales bacterium]|nr:ABC transporter ATP-binding protein [Clostridiales bacterium]
MRKIKKSEKPDPFKPKYGNIDNVVYVLRGIRQYDRSLLWLVGLNILAAALSELIPVILPKTIIDELLGKGRVSAVLTLTALFGLLTLVTRVTANTSENTVFNRFIAVRLHFIARAGEKFMRMDYQSLEDPEVLDLSQRGDRACSNNVDGIEGIMHRTQGAAQKLLTMAGTAAIISTLHPFLLIAMALLLFTNFLMTSYTQKKNKEEHDRLAPVWRRRGYLEEVMGDFAFAKDIRLFSMRGLLRSRLVEQQKENFRGDNRVRGHWARATILYATSSLFQEIILYAWLCTRVLAGTMSIGEFTMYAAAIRTFSGALDGFIGDLVHIRRQNEVLSDYRGFLDYPDTPAGTKPLPAGLEQEPLCFELRDISFRYPRQESYALRHVSLTIRPQEKLAVVGLNGAGKSTFVKLLTRLYEPDEGCILLNGVDIRTYDREAYTRLFSAVFQEIETFAFTVAENVAMCPIDEINRERVAEALEDAGLGKRIRELEKGIDRRMLKVIDEGGVEFSGGENQKLALARALYKQAPVLLLDEPTAALDALAEERLYREFSRMVQNKTAIYISHRLASTQFCDRVLLFENGEIVESGNHQELLSRGGRYAELFQVQAAAYREEEGEK